MAHLKIQVFKGRATEPSTTARIPVRVLRIASSLIPGKAARELEEQGIDVEAIIAAAENPDAHGVLTEVEDHEKDQRIVISVE